nr:MAG: hypothetical protein 2 [Leviviridae sp.]
MAFSDPLALTIGGSARSLVRVRATGQYGSEYLASEATQEFRAFIRTQELPVEPDGRRKVRHNISVRQTVFATATTPEIIRQHSASTLHYKGDDVTAWDDVALAVAGMTTAPNCVKLNNYES